MHRLPEFPNLHVVDHPLVQDAVTRMRDHACQPPAFRALLRAVTMMVAYSATERLPLTTRRILTPLEEMDAATLAGNPVSVVAILRAGLGMSEVLRDMVPGAEEGHIGLARDPHTHEPAQYLVRLPPLIERTVIVCDPMLATGNSAAQAIDVLKEKGAEARRMTLLTLVCAPEGVRRMAEAHGDVPIYTAALDRELDDNAYIRPGLGDAGDRLFGTPHL